MKAKPTFRQILYYGLPGLPLAMLGLPLFVYLPSYYSQGLGLSFTAVGLALLVARMLDLLTDPLIGWLNDQLSWTKWRRKIFILAGLPILLLGLNFLLNPHTTGAGTISVTYLFGWSFVTYLGWTLINIPWLAWGAEISQDYHSKSSLASSREIFSVLGTIVVITLPVALSIQADLQKTLALLATLLNWLLPLLLLLLLWKVPDINKNSTGSRQSKTTGEQFKKLVRISSNPAIKKLLPSYFINSIANALPATLFILFVTHVLKTPDKVGILLMCYFVSAIAGLPIWLYLAKKTDKHRSWTIALLVSVASFIWVPLLGEGDYLAFLLICLASGFALGADVVLPSSIQADIAQHINREDLDNHSEFSVAGQDTSGFLFGLWGLLTKLALALAIGIAFPLLDVLGLESESPSKLSLITLAVLYALIPVFLKLWVVIKMWNFPFDQDYFVFQRQNSNKGKNNENTHTPAASGGFTGHYAHQRM